MEARLQRRVQRYGWDRAAPHYEQFWRRQLAPGQQRVLEIAALRPGERVLEIACGTGLVTFPAAEAVTPSGAVLATDISDSMVAYVGAEAARLGVTHVTAVRMGAEELEVPDASFDVALCAFGLMYVPDVAVALTEMRRVLRPGGRAVISVWGARHKCGWAEVFPIVGRRVASEVCPLFFQVGTGDSLRIRLEQAGFRDVALERLRVDLDYGSDDEACGAAFIGGPVALAYARFDDRARLEANGEYLASISRFRRGTGYAVPGEFVIAMARA